MAEVEVPSSSGHFSEGFTDSQLDSGVGKDDSRYQDILTKTQLPLTRDLDTKDILDYLYQEGVISEEEKDTIESGKTRLDRTQKLMFVLGNRPILKEEHFERFIKALKDGGYAHLADLLNQAEKKFNRVIKGHTANTDNSNHEEEFVANFQVPEEQAAKQRILRTSLEKHRKRWLNDLNYDAILGACLIQEDILTSQMAEEIQVTHGRKEQISLLMQKLADQGPQALDVFKKALIETNQSHLAQLLDERPWNDAELEKRGRLKKELACVLPNTMLLTQDEPEAPEAKIIKGFMESQGVNSLLETEGATKEAINGDQMEKVSKELKEISDEINIDRNLLMCPDVPGIQSTWKDDLHHKVRETLENDSLSMGGIATILIFTTETALKTLQMKTEQSKEATFTILNGTIDYFMENHADKFIEEGGWVAFLERGKKEAVIIAKKAKKDAFLKNISSKHCIIICNSNEKTEPLVSRLVESLRKKGIEEIVTERQLDDLPDPFEVLQNFAYMPMAFVVFLQSPYQHASQGPAASLAYDALIAPMLSHTDSRRRILPLLVLGALRKMLPKPLQTAQINFKEAFLDPKQLQNGRHVDAAVNEIKAAYDERISDEITKQLKGNNELCFEIKLIISLENQKSLEPLVLKNHLINIKSSIRIALDDNWHEVRQHLDKMYDIRNIRHRSLDDTEPMILEIVAHRVETVDKIRENIRNGGLAMLFPDKVSTRQGTPKWFIEASVDEEKLAQVRAYLMRKHTSRNLSGDDGEVKRSRKSPSESPDITAPKTLQTDGCAAAVNPAAATTKVSSNKSSDSVKGRISPPIVQSVQVTSANRSMTDDPTKLRIIGNVINGIVSKEDYYPYDLQQCLEKYKDVVKFDKVHDKEGHNILHMIVVGQLHQHLKVVFYLNLWGELREQVVEDGKGYSGFTPRAISEKLLYKAKGPKVLDEFDYYDELLYSVPDLSKSCLAGKKEYVKHMVAKRPDEINVRDRSGANAMFYASACGDVSIMEFLLNQGADPTIVNEKKETCLHIASFFGRSNAVEFLLKRCMLDPMTKDEAKNRAIDYPAINGDVDTMKVYQKNGHDPDTKAVSLAAKHQRLPMVKYLTDECGLSVEGLDDHQRTPLINAGIHLHLDMLKFLIEKGANLQHRDKHQRNIFHHMAEHYKEEKDKAKAFDYIVEVTLEKGILSQLLNGHDKFCGRELVLLVRGRDKGRKAWHYVDIKRFLFNLFKKKLASGSIDVKLFGQILHSGFGRSPAKEITEEVDKMLEARLETKEDNADMTPLHMAIFKDHELCVKKLLEHGAKINEKDSFGLTPLHMAGMTGNIEIAKMLEQYGANFNLRSSEGKNPADVAEENEHDKLVNLIRGKQMFSQSKEFCDLVKVNCNQLNESVLEQKRNSGLDVRRHIVAVLRDIQIDINTTLLALGSGPVQEESTPSQNEGRHYVY